VKDIKLYAGLLITLYILSHFYKLL